MTISLFVSASVDRPGPVAFLPRRRGSPIWVSLLVALAFQLDAAAGDFELAVVDGATTVRRTCREARGGGVDAPVLLNGGFSEGLDAWTAGESGGSAAPGSAAVEGASAVLREGDSFLVTLSQSFTVPEQARALSFTVRLEPGFDASDASIPDAFEVSLLDQDLRPVVGSWSDEATSFLNFQETGAVLAAPGVTWEGDRATVDLGGVPKGTAVTLYFDLIGADGDVASAVRLDDVEATVGPPEGSFIRGNADDSTSVDITDPIMVLSYLFIAGVAPTCLDAADADNDGAINITDPIYILNFLFLAGTPIPSPYPACGLDEGEEDDLGCAPCSCPPLPGGDPCP